MIFYLKRKHLSAFFCLLFVLTVVLSGYLFLFEFQKFEKEISQISLAQIPINLFRKQPQPVTLAFVGDIMLDRGVEYMIKKYGQGDYRWSFQQITEDLKEVDILFGNLESVISDKGRKVGSINSFRAEPKAIEGLVFAGFDILSVANNHIFDYSKEAMKDSFKRLKAANIDFVGGGFSAKEAHSPLIKEIEGTKIAFLAYTNLGSRYWVATGNQSGIAWLDEKIKDDIKIVKEKADIVIVSMHFGEEYQEKPNSEQEYFSRLAIDSGADLVIGHHPHVVQPIEKYKDGFIAYSLGNFVFDQGFSKETMKSLLLKVVVENRKIVEIDSKNVKINEFFQPELLE